MTTHNAMIEDGNSGLKIGILGGGQLGKMLCQAASRWSLDLHVLDQSKDYPAARVCPSFHLGDFKDFDDVMRFGLQMDLVTIEIESVNTQALFQLAKEGVAVYPQPHILEIVNDKGCQKTFYREESLPTTPFQLIEDRSALIAMYQSGMLSLPVVQKSRTGGYDGRGVQVIRDEEDLLRAFDCPSVLEDLVSIDQEIGVIVARNKRGEVALYPPVEMVFHPDANLVEYLVSPARITQSQAEEVARIAQRIADALGIVGLLAVEFFIDTQGQLLINEVAPRTHNSGHHTIEAGPCSQFEQQFRALLGFPLGDTRQDAAHAAMINLLGPDSFSGPPSYPSLATLLEMPGVYPHIYGKPLSKPNRKMGHITVLSEDREVLKSTLSKIKNLRHIQPFHTVLP